MNDREGPRSLGRGAGVNKPAWMVAKERSEGGPTGIDNGGAGGGDDRLSDRGSSTGGGDRGGDRGDRNNSPERDQFGRVRGSGSRDGRGDGSSRGGDDRNGRRDDHGGDRGRRSREDFRGGGGRRDDRHDRRGRDHHQDRRGGGGGGGGGNRSGIYFHSYEEERAWLEERRRKRRTRKSLFDVEPTPEQAAMDEARAALEKDHLLRTGGAAAVYGGGGVIAGGGSSSYGGRDEGSRGGGRSLQPQQTRHARRLYVGNIPDISENEVHNFFRDAIRTAVIVDSQNNPNASSHRAQYVENDPILSVYINRERRFAFLEFKTMEICTACLAFDGIDVMGRGKVKVKRPNDYNPALAPTTNAATLPQLDTSRLGIVSPSVPDGPNKIFIGGLPYHLTESQVLELLGAFGTVRAFHLVKQDPTAVTSKGYCFVEYSDSNVTQIAVMGLNGMDMGGGKQLSARSAVGRGAGEGMDSSAMGGFGPPVAAPPVSTTVVDGVDVDALLAAALGGGGGMPMAMPAAPMMMQQQQPTMAMGAMPQYGIGHMAMVPQQQPMLVTDPLAVANAAASALDAAFGGGLPTMAAAPAAMPTQQAQMGASMSQPPQAPAGGMGPTRILVLLNMVADEDLQSDEDHKFLSDEVREEAGKYGNLVSMKIPRPQVCC